MRGYREFRRGWPIVLSSTIGIALGLAPMAFYTIGVFAPELARAFHWGIGDIMAGFTVTTFGVLLVGPFVGWLADRYGVRRVTLVSVLAFGLALATFSLQTGSLGVFYASWALTAIAGAGTLPITWTRAVNHWFDARKGLALGLALTGTGLSGFVLKPTTAAAIAAFGWRGAYLLLAALPILISLPLAFFCFRDAPPGNVDSDGRRAPVALAAGFTFRETVRDWRFWVLGFSFLPVAFAVGGPIPNLETILATHGLSRAAILAVVPFLGLSVIFSRLAGGWLIDRIWAPAVAVVLLSIPAVSAWLLVYAPVTQRNALLAIIGFGIAAGVEYDLMAFLAARYFGTRHYGAIYGTLYGFFALGTGIGPLVYGRIYDATKTYDVILVVGAGVMIGGALLLLTLGRYRFLAHAEH